MNTMKNEENIKFNSIRLPVTVTNKLLMLKGAMPKTTYEEVIIELINFYVKNTKKPITI